MLAGWYTNDSCQHSASIDNFIHQHVFGIFFNQDDTCFFQFVPRYWKLSISTWISALSDEFGYIKKWVDMNIDPANEPRLPKELWLPAIIHPKGNKSWIRHTCVSLW